jgi:hypothetical protein
MNPVPSSSRQPQYFNIGDDEDAMMEENDETFKNAYRQPGIPAFAPFVPESRENRQPVLVPPGQVPTIPDFAPMWNESGKPPPPPPPSSGKVKKKNVKGEQAR